MAEIKDQNKLNQFDGGIHALLSFSLDYAEGYAPEQVHVENTDTWQIIIEIPGSPPTQLLKNSPEDYYFPNPNEEKIAVFFNPGELDLLFETDTLELRYEVVKTTNGIENRGNIRSMTLQKSLSDYPPTVPPAVPADGTIPRFDPAGRLVESLLVDTGTGLEYDGNPVGTNGGGDMQKTVYDTDNDGVVDEAETAFEADYADEADFAEDSAALGGLPASSYQLKPVINTQSGTSYTLQAGDNGKILRFTNPAEITVTLPGGITPLFACLIESVQANVVIDPGAGVTVSQPDKTVTALKSATLYSTDADIFKLQGATE